KHIDAPQDSTIPGKPDKPPSVALDIENHPGPRVFQGNHRPRMCRQRGMRPDNAVHRLLRKDVTGADQPASNGEGRKPDGPHKNGLDHQSPKRLRRGRTTPRETVTPAPAVVLRFERTR